MLSAVMSRSSIILNTVAARGFVPQAWKHNSSAIHNILYYIILYYIILCYVVMLYYIILYYIISYHISCHVKSCQVMSGQVMSYISYYIILYLLYLLYYIILYYYNYHCRFVIYKIVGSVNLFCDQFRLPTFT